MRKKLKNSGGFSFVEMLCAVAVLVLLCLMMNTGVNMAIRSYRDITAESEAELLVSSLTDALTDKLRYCVVTETPGVAGTASTYSPSIGDVAVKDDKLVVQVKDKDGNVTVKQLLPDGAYGTSGKPNDSYGTSGGYVGRYKVEQVKNGDGALLPPLSYDSNTNSFTVRFTVTAEKSGSIKQDVNFTVRCLNPVK